FEPRNRKRQEIKKRSERKNGARAAQAPARAFKRGLPAPPPAAAPPAVMTPIVPAVLPAIVAPVAPVFPEIAPLPRDGRAVAGNFIPVGAAAEIPAQLAPRFGHVSAVAAKFASAMAPVRRSRRAKSEEAAQQHRSGDQISWKFHDSSPS